MVHKAPRVKKILRCLTIALGISCIGTVVYYYQHTSRHIYLELKNSFHEAIAINAQNKTNQTTWAGSYEYDPNLIGSYEEKTIRLPDTTFVFKRKVVDPETDMFRGRQLELLMTDNLKSEDIRLVYDSLLHKRNIYVPHVIGVTASFYKKVNDWTRDTTSIAVNYKVSLTQQGPFEDINYYAHIEVSFLCICQQMPKQFILFLLISTFISGLFWLYVSQRSSPLDYYESITIKYFPGKDMVLDGQLLSIGNDSVKLSLQNTKLMRMFFHTKRFRLHKEMIKNEFWPHNPKPTTNMTSAIDRLKQQLCDLDKGLTVITDPNSDEFYILVLIENQELPSNNKLVTEIS